MSLVFRTRFHFSVPLLLSLLLSACGAGTSSGGSADSANALGIPTDTATIAKGEASFIRNCSGCHNFRQDGIGPQLGGITTQVSPDWIRSFIKNPQQVIAGGDDKARALQNKYKVVMPSFPNFDDNDLTAIIAYLHTHKQVGTWKPKAKANAITNPIPEPIPLSSLVANLQPITQIPASNPVAPLTRITKMDYRPDTHQLFVVDLRGKLYSLKNNKPSIYLDLARQRPKFIHEPGLATGFGSFAFHPDFAHNGLLYTSHTEVAGSGKADFHYPDSIKVALQFVVTEWKTPHPDADTFSGTSREILRIDMITESHGMQEITFNPLSKPGAEDYGLLYIGIGDGGCTQIGYPFFLRGIRSIWGTVLRIDPRGSNSANGRYGIPENNPFVKQNDPEILKEIYAYGFRNPQRITWSRSGKMLVCNIGQANIESLYVVTPGMNGGWPIREGTFAFDPNGDLNKIYPLPPNDSINKITYPVAQFDHDEGNAWSGGYEYWGSAIPQLKGKYLFGDIPSGKLFYIDMADIHQGKQAPIRRWQITINKTPQTLRDVCGSDRVDLHFARDAAGEMYIFTKADGRIYKIVSAHQ